MPKRFCEGCRAMVDTRRFAKKPATQANKARYATHCNPCCGLASTAPTPRLSCGSRTLKRYGLTTPSSQALWDAQGRKCKVCACDLFMDHDTSVDYCRASSRVRGLLCARCNRLVGALEANMPKLRKMLDYLLAHKPK